MMMASKLIKDESAEIEDLRKQLEMAKASEAEAIASKASAEARHANQQRRWQAIRERKGVKRGTSNGNEGNGGGGGGGLMVRGTSASDVVSHWSQSASPRQAPHTACEVIWGAPLKVTPMLMSKPVVSSVTSSQPPGPVSITTTASSVDGQALPTTTAGAAAASAYKAVCCRAASFVGPEPLLTLLPSLGHFQRR